MKLFRVTPTNAQAEFILPYIEEAEKQGDEKNQIGAVFCQAKRDYRCGPIRIVGNFIPEPYARRISDILIASTRQDMGGVSETSFIEIDGTEHEVPDKVAALFRCISEEYDDLNEYNRRLLFENLAMGLTINNLRECAQCLAGRVDELEAVNGE